MRSGRFEAIKELFGGAELLALAADLDLRHRGSGRNRCECPGCRNGDPRGASLGERDGVGVWKCHRDEQHRGTAIDLLALARAIGNREALEQLEWRAGLARSLPMRRTAVPPARPPAHEVAEVWAQTCRPLSLVPEMAAEWAARGIDMAHVEDRDLARALQPGAELPRWAFGAGQSWSAGAHRLIVPLFDSAGRLASLHARAAGVPDGRPKGLSPLGCTVAGLIMADPLARLMLAGADPGAETVRRCDLVVAEGVPDFLTWATRWGDAAEGAPAVLGLISGSWTEEIAARVPDGTAVYVRQHADEAGAKYTARVLETLGARCSVSVTAAEGGAP